MADVVAMLNTVVLPTGRVTPVGAKRPWATRRQHGVLLLAAAALWPELTGPQGTHYHVTLSYALPLALDSGWRTWSEDHLAELIEAAQLVVLPAADFLVVQPSGQIQRRHARLLRRHAATMILEHDDTDAYLWHWAAFVAQWFGRSVSAHEQAVLGDMLAMSGCHVGDIVHGSSVIGRSVTCIHPASRVVFDLMTTWDPGAAHLRPGVFAGVHNLLDAFDRRLRYSLCYGRFLYKDEIVAGSCRLMLADLLDSAVGSPPGEPDQ
ncbi:MAG: hypothetical protein ACRDJG_07625 [Actinomycetota bacterium]